MVSHKAVNMKDCPVPLMGRLQIGEKSLSIFIRPEDGLSLVSSRGHMIKSIRILNTQWTGHYKVSFPLN